MVASAWECTPQIPTQMTAVAYISAGRIQMVCTKLKNRADHPSSAGEERELEPRLEESFPCKSAGARVRQGSQPSQPPLANMYATAQDGGGRESDLVLFRVVSVFDLRSAAL